MPGAAGTRTSSKKKLCDTGGDVPPTSAMTTRLRPTFPTGWNGLIRERGWETPIPCTGVALVREIRGLEDSRVLEHEWNLKGDGSALAEGAGGSNLLAAPEVIKCLVHKATGCVTETRDSLA